MNLLFVAHRYYPFPGGTEYYVQAMAEEALSRGHTVSVFAGEHKGDQNGVTVTSDPEALMKPYDLIIVHGGDVGVQNFVLENAPQIPSPIMFMIIKPSNSQVYKNALQNCRYLTWSTPYDLEFLTAAGVADKAVNVRHGIKPVDSIGRPNFKQRLGIEDKTMFLSCGGYWPNKMMRELVDVFKSVGRENAVLVTTGYDNRFGIAPTPSDGIIPLMIEDKVDVMDAIVSADCYILHSNSEGFGLVLLESMLNKTPWIARNIAGATLMERFGKVYDNDEQLAEFIRDFKRNEDQVDAAYDYVINNHLIKNTIDDIESAIR